MLSKGGIYCDRFTNGDGRMIEYKSNEVVKVNAIQWTGDNANELDSIINKSSGPEGESFIRGDEVFLSTADGMAAVPIGGYIVEHVTGDLFYCPQDEFSKKYEPMRLKDCQPMLSAKNTVTKEHLDGLVAKSDVEYAVFGNKLTVAVITLPNKFKVTGEASCVDPNNFDKALGEKYALENAVGKLWELEGYLFATELQRRADWNASPKASGTSITSTSKG